MYSATIERALQVAIAAHDGQKRKSSADVPYVVHPVHVALLLARWGQDDDVIVAGLLHDVVEDSPAWTRERIEAEFGAHVAGIVAELTEDKSKSWEERKRAGVERVARLSPQAATVKAADKLHNLQDLAHELRRAADPAVVWQQFRRPPEPTLAMSAELVEALCTRVEPRVAKALRAALKAALDAHAATARPAVSSNAPR
jgi:(p)ppGpp synthase/HD superfamily hydrolase